MTEQELIWNEVNCTTGEVITRPYTAEERADWEANRAAVAAALAEQTAKEEALAALKASAKAKLIAGTPLTEEEAEVLVL